MKMNEQSKLKEYVFEYLSKDASIIIPACVHICDIYDNCDRKWQFTCTLLA